MAKFNLSKKEESLTLNNEGQVAYKMNDKEKLASMVLTSLFNENKFYGDNSNELVELAKKLVENGQGRFVANLAVFARNEMNLRSVSHVLCSILASEENGKGFVKYATLGVCRRADDITEILSCYLNMKGKPIPNSLKKALALAMNNFDEYQFGKYNHNSKELNFKDVLRLTHAKAKDEKHNKIFKKIIEDDLATPYTWETELSAKGNTKEVWEELIDSGKVGTMALLRNLNNILNAQPRNLQKVYKTITDKNAILNSKILPFRFYSAYKKVSQNPNCTSKILDILEEAIEISTKNIEKLKGKTLIAIDVSGSMTYNISKRSEMSPAEIATLLASMANYICEESIVVSFDTRLYVNTFSKRAGIIANARSIKINGGGTAIGLPIAYLLDKNIKVDRIILLSDCEVNSQIREVVKLQSGDKVVEMSCAKLLNKYISEVNPNVKFHGIDLVGYGTQQFKGKNVDILAGWSEKIFDIIHLSEQGYGNFVKIIENYDEVSDYVNADAEG